MFNFIKKYLSENTGILIRLDDIAENMNWPLMKRCEVLFDKYNIKPLLGVISNNKDPQLLSHPKNESFWSQVRIWKEKNWEISMHGYTHVYDKETNKKDYFNYGGKSEFFGHTYEEQFSRIKKSLQIFENKNIKIRSFFAPNHTYDENTFKALKLCGINEVIDGYGFQPYVEKDFVFIPQLFYRLINFPFSFQTTQLHLNEWTDITFNNFETFVLSNKDKIITYDKMLSKTSNDIFISLMNNLLKHSLITLRKFRNN